MLKDQIFLCLDNSSKFTKKTKVLSKGGKKALPLKQTMALNPAISKLVGNDSCCTGQREQDGSIPAHLGTTSIPWIIANQQVVFCSGAGKSLWGSSAEPATCCCPQGWKRMRGCKCSLYPCGHCSHLISTVQFPYDIIDTQTNSAQECQE